MRLLHTSDWHLGQTLHNFDRTHEHQCFLDWLLDSIQAEQADALLVSGDVFDNANPSAAAQKQLYRFLQAARARVPHLNIVLIAGNHDSPGRLEAPAPLLKWFDTAVIGHITRTAEGEIDLERLVVPLRDHQGRVRAWCLAIPFLRPGDVPRIETEGDPYLAGIAHLYQQTLELALSRREPGQAIVALGHCHMDGGEVSETSERRIVVGGAEALPAGMFDERVAYAALGHLHLAQRVGGREALRYSGSPLPMSFSEINYPHQILRIDFAGDAVAGIQAIRVPRFVDLLRIPARPARLGEVLAELAALELPERQQEEHPYLEVRVCLDGPEPGLRAKVESALEGKPVRLAKIETSHARAGATQAPANSASLDDLNRLQPEDIFRKLYQQKFDSDAPEPLLRAFGELLVEPVEEPAP